MPPGRRHPAFGSRVMLVPKPYSLFAAPRRSASIFMVPVLALARLGARAVGQRQPGRVGVEESLLARHLRRPAAETAADDRDRMPMHAVRGAGPDYFLPHWGVLHIVYDAIITQGRAAACRKTTQFDVGLTIVLRRPRSRLRHHGPRRSDAGG